MRISLFAKPRRFGDEVLKAELGSFSLFRCTWNHSGKPFELRYCKHPKANNLWITFNGKLWKLRHEPSRETRSPA